MTRDEIILEKIAAGEKAEERISRDVENNWEVNIQEFQTQIAYTSMMYLSAIAHSLLPEDD
jgi:hypothetical protein